MWPWEHLASGYLVYSLIKRSLGADRPTDREAIAVAFGTQFPDLVDKPLGWGTTLLPSGTSLAHSLLFAVPVSMVVLLLARRSSTEPIGWAFATGYLAHLPGDVIYPALLGGDLHVSFLLWPLLGTSSAPPGPIADYVGHLLVQFTDIMTTPAGRLYLALEVGLLGLALLAWIMDGRPGIPTPSNDEQTCSKQQKID